MANFPFKKGVMEEGIATLSQPNDPTYNVGEGDDRSFFNQFNEKFGIGEDPYHNSPKTTSLFEVDGTPVSAGDAFQTWDWGRGETPSFNLGSLFSSQYMPYAIAAVLRDHGLRGEKERFEEAVDRGEYKSALAQQGLPSLCKGPACPL